MAKGKNNAHSSHRLPGNSTITTKYAKIVPKSVTPNPTPISKTTVALIKFGNKTVEKCAHNSRSGNNHDKATTKIGIATDNANTLIQIFDLRQFFPKIFLFRDYRINSVRLKKMQGIVHFSFKNEKNNQLFDELLGGKEVVLGEAVCFMSCDELMLWFPLMLPTILKQKIQDFLNLGLFTTRIKTYR
jgi:hypothetical protein